MHDFAICLSGMVIREPTQFRGEIIPEKKVHFSWSSVFCIELCTTVFNSRLSSVFIGLAARPPILCF
jgi:hypothetical protein